MIEHPPRKKGGNQDPTAIELAFERAEEKKKAAARKVAEKAFSPVGTDTDVPPEGQLLQNPWAKYGNQGEVMRQKIGELYPSGEVVPSGILDKYNELFDRQQESFKTGDEAEQAAVAEEIGSFISGLAKKEEPFDPHSVPSVDESNLNASQYAVNPEMQADMDAFTSAGMTDDTPKELKQKLREIIGKFGEGAKEKLRMSERGEKLKNYLDTRLEKYRSVGEGTKAEQIMRSLGEKYNKLPMWQKIGAGVGLGVTAGTAMAFGSPLVLGVSMLGIGGQRIMGFMGKFLEYEKGSEGEKWGKEKAMGEALLYTTAMTAGMLALSYGVKEAVQHAREQGWDDTAVEWIKRFAPVAGGAASSSTFDLEIGEGGSIETDSSSAPAEDPSQASATTTTAPKAMEHTPGFQGEVRHSDLSMQHAEAPAIAPKAPLAKLHIEPRMVTPSELDPYFSPPRVESSIAEGQNIKIGDDIREKALASVASLNQNGPAEAASLNVVPGASTASPEDSAVTAPTSPSFETAKLPEPQGFVVDSEGIKVLDSERQPVHTGSFEPAPDTSAGVETKPDAPREISPSMEPTNEQAPAPVETAVETVKPVSEIPAIYEATTSLGEKVLVADGGDDKSRLNFMQEFLQKPENQGKTIRWSHSVPSIMGPRIQVDELSAETIGGRTSWFPNFFSEPVEFPERDTFKPIDIGPQTAPVSEGSEVADVVARATVERAQEEAVVAVHTATERAVQEAAEANAVTVARELSDEATRRAEALARARSVLDTKITPDDAAVLDETDRMAGRTGPVQETAPAPEASTDAFAEAKAIEAQARIDDAVAAAKAESARLLAEAEANEAARMAAEKAQEEASAATRVATEKAAQEAATIKAEAIRVAAEARVQEAAAAAQKLADEAAEAQRIADLAAAQKTPEPAPVAVETEAPQTEAPKAPPLPVEAPHQVEVAPKADASEAVVTKASQVEAPKPEASPVGNVTNKMLNTLPTEQLDKMMTPEIAKAAQAYESKALALFDGGFNEKGINSPTWKATASKPIEFLLAVNNSSILKNLVETGRADAKYLGKPVAFAQEVLGIERDAHAIGISEKFGKIHEYFNGHVKKIPFLPKETVAEYMTRISKVLALRK